MGITYRVADPDVCDLVEEIKAQYHRELNEEKVTITTLLCFGGLNHHGWPAAGLAKVNSLKDRVAGLTDCTLILDGEKWENFGPLERKALIDHELHHYEVLRDKAGNPKSDDAHRPRLRCRPHDWEMGGFDHIVERWKRASLEAQQLVAAARRLVQHDLPFFEDKKAS